MMGTQRPVQLWLVVAAVLVTVAAGAGIGIAATGIPDVRPDASPTASAAPAPDPGRSNPAPQALVRLTEDAAGTSSARDVAALLDRHFTAINQRDFDTWKTTVTVKRSTKESADHWRTVYRSTVDSDVVVSSIRPTATGLLVAITFRSVQDPVDAPADLAVARLCWSSQWPVDGKGGSLRIGAPATGTTEKQQC